MYNFIETAIKKLRELKEKYNKNNKNIITWLVDSENYTSTDISNFKKTAHDLGVSIKIFTNKQEFINYINTQSIDGHGKRLYKISRFDSFSHGYVDRINYGKNFNVFKGDFSKIISNFYSCNTGTGDDNSLGKAWFNLTKGEVTACVNRTDYEHITMLEGKINVIQHMEIKELRAETGYKQDGSLYYPIPTKSEKKPGHWIIFY